MFALNAHASKTAQTAPVVMLKFTCSFQNEDEARNSTFPSRCADRVVFKIQDSKNFIIRLKTY